VDNCKSSDNWCILTSYCTSLTRQSAKRGRLDGELEFARIVLIASNVRVTKTTGYTYRDCWYNVNCPMTPRRHGAIAPAFGDAGFFEVPGLRTKYIGVDKSEIISSALPLTSSFTLFSRIEILVGRPFFKESKKMAIVIVTYDLKRLGQNYQGVHDYLKRFTYCKHLESVWLLDTVKSVSSIRDSLRTLTDNNDVIFVAQLQPHQWASLNFGCAEWLNQPGRGW
jgi:hypothetical protein